MKCNPAAKINVVLRYRLWPRSMVQPPLTQADKIMLIRLAGMEVRLAGGKVAASFASEADEDPLGSVP